MSDSRRRRKSNQSCGSDDLSDSYEELNATKETQSSEQTDGHQDSECDIYESDSDTESQEGGEQRESGDGQEEEKPQKKLDDDEDRRNPQYIPKRGTFYEHDDRTTDEVTENNTEQQTNAKETKEKKVWKDKEDRWDHDRYNDEEQAPKRPEELIATYGYDIRNEEGPPRARRRRRYGRGPNKYTRNWEDEDAYGKTTTGRGNNRRFQKNNEDFPALGNSKNTPNKVEEPVISSAWYSSKNKTQNKTQNFPPLQSQQDNAKTKPTIASNTSTGENKASDESTNISWKKDSRHVTQNQNTNGNIGDDGEKLANTKPSSRETNKRNTQESVSLVASRTRGRGFKSNANNNMVTNRIVENKVKGRGPGPVTIENRRNTVQHNEDHQLAHDMKQQLNINDGSQYHQPARHNKGFFTSANQHRSNTVPPRMQQQQQQQQSHQQQTHLSQQTLQQQQDSSGNRPKRYSSLRQRPTITETSAQQNYPSQHAQHGYFPPQAGNSRTVLESQGYPQSHFEQSSPVAPATAPMAGQPVISLPPGGQAASYAPPPFLVPPPQFIPPQTAPPSIINYVPGPNGPTFPPNFQGYQGYNPSVQPQGPPPPQELYQPQGCTYYSPAQQQQQQQQAAPLRRPKAAIPILPPPDNQQSVRGRGRSAQYQNNQSSSNMQQTEQEAKSGNMVESGEKPVPGQFDSAQTEQSSILNQEPQKDQDPEMIRTVNDLDEKVEMITNADSHIKINASSVIKDNLDGSVSVQELLEATSNEKNTVSHSPTTLASVEIELGNIESAIPESTIVEKAAA
ncbi:PREDICTED: protein CASC3-like isoform X1 [Cyphomyrmex costatus]|uniref:Protein CASC3 n=1 Tax=Cyphomyrmex costatus TaxID=456900 RepID=A0A151IFS3_9HYME|nr:PREDICTED: protein CASC3-like isoform X1 [Cyphomyrmex costatus]KYN00007.1 Protein CASC3 [Cyphomyrmex costatus]